MLKTFRLGGVHPHDHKISKDAAIRIFDVPKTVTIPLGQHIGAPATAAVKKATRYWSATLSEPQRDSFRPISTARYREP